MQKHINKWEKEEDKDSKKTFVEFRDYCFENDRIDYHNKNALGGIGIANSIKNIDLKITELEKKLDFTSEVLAKTVNALKTVQENNNTLEEKLNNAS